MRGAHHGCRAGVIGCGGRTTSGLGARCAHQPRRGAPGRGFGGSAFAPPLSTADPATLLVYVMDIYDPASWAYLPSVSAVLSAACTVVDVEVVQSGRFATGSPAACLIALLAAGDLPVSTVLGAVQHQYFERGLPLDSPGVVGAIADDLGLDGPAIEIFARSPRARELASEDFALAHDLDLGGGPVLLASRGEQVFEFDGPGATGDRLVDQFRTVLTRP
jgi:DSBA-like thioredoxin domain-containing protein